MLNNKYMEMNLDELGGICRSLFNKTAMTPSRKKRSAGLLRFSRMRLACIKWVSIKTKDPERSPGLCGE
jgi:hypothetical protein